MLRSPSLDSSKRKFSQAKIIHGTAVPMVPAATNVRAGPDRRLPRDRARPSPIASLPCHLVADPFFAQQLFRLDSDTDQLRTQLASIPGTGAVRCAPARQGHNPGPA